MHYAFMEAKDRLTEARKKAGYGSASDAARAFGWAIPTYTGHENGSRGIRWEAAQAYGKAFRVSPLWIMEGRGERDVTYPMVPLVGYVGAGAEVRLFDGDASTERIDEVEGPPTADEHIVAVIVRGDSMAPVFPDRSIIFYRNIPGPPDQVINQECIVRLADGRTFVKILQRGSEHGLYNLFSYNAPLMVDLAVEWAVRVRWVDRGA